MLYVCKRTNEDVLKDKQLSRYYDSVTDLYEDIISCFDEISFVKKGWIQYKLSVGKKR